MENKTEKTDPRQIMIVRQSQLKMAQEWAQSCGYCLDLIELVTLSEVLTDYVMEGPGRKGIVDRVRKVDEHFKTKHNGKK